uniref:Uncharacterized protein n=1 Tax=viral metagenome TaxID=1070528 RepID=A0A6C0I9M9_9ZZZZ
MNKQQLINFYKKYKIIIFVVIAIVVITLVIILYNTFFNNDPSNERNLCDDGEFCNKDQVCDDLCTPGQKHCISKDPCPTGQIFYCDRGDTKPGCAPQCDNGSALLKCDDHTFKCIADKPPIGAIDVIDNCDWMNGTFYTTDNCRLYSPYDSTGRLYSSCVDQTDSYGQLEGNSFTDEKGITVTCGVPGAESGSLNISKAVGMSQRNYNYEVIKQTTDTTTVNNTCSIPDLPPSKLKKISKEKFTDDPVSMKTICTNTNNNFVNNDESTGNVPSQVFCDYDYTNKACKVEKDCKDFNYGFNEYAYILGCTPDGKQSDNPTQDCIKIPQWMFPSNCSDTQTTDQCLLFTNNCESSYDVSFERLQNSCEMDADGCGVYETTDGNYIPYILTNGQCVATLPDSSTVTEPPGKPGCRPDDKDLVYSWTGAQCIPHIHLSILTMNEINIRENINIEIGIHGISFDVDFTGLSQTLQNQIIDIINDEPTSVIIYCYKAEQTTDGKYITLYDKNNPQIYFDTSLIKSRYHYYPENSQIIFVGESATYIIATSEAVNQGNVNLVQLSSGGPYYLGISISWNDQMTLNSKDLKLPTKDSQNTFNYLK